MEPVSSGPEEREGEGEDNSPSFAKTKEIRLTFGASACLSLKRQTKKRVFSFVTVSPLQVGRKKTCSVFVSSKKYGGINRYYAKKPDIFEALCTHYSSAFLFLKKFFRPNKLVFTITNGHNVWCPITSHQRPTIYTRQTIFLGYGVKNRLLVSDFFLASRLFIPSEK